MLDTVFRVTIDTLAVWRVEEGIKVVNIVDKWVQIASVDVRLVRFKVFFVVRVKLSVSRSVVVLGIMDSKKIFPVEDDVKDVKLCLTRLGYADSS